MELFKRQKKIKCHLGSDSYEVIVGSNLLHQAGDLIDKHLKLDTDQVLVVSTKKIAAFYEKILKASLKRSGFKVNFYIVPDGEIAKSERVLFGLLRYLAENRYERGSLIIALGGGVVGDLSAFAASIYMRGMKFVNIPTTLLAQVDSAIGGKTAINIPEGKNLIGTFYQPRLVISDASTISTLPQKEVISGLAEVIKYAIIFDHDFFNYLEQNISKVNDLDFSVIEKVILKCSQYKIRVVEKDEKEGGLRAVLNLGHTFAHAFEVHLNYKVLTHGMAVGLGLIGASILANQLGMFDDGSVERVYRLVKKAGLPTSLEPYSFDASKLVNFMYSDKKVKAKKVNFILPIELGHVVIKGDVTNVQIKKALRY